MKKKTFITATLTAMLAVSSPLYAGATLTQIALPISQPSTENTEQQQISISHIYETKAEALAINIDGEQIISLLVKELGNYESEILFKVFEDTIFVDNEQGIPANPREISEGDIIYIYGSSAMTRSLPPQSNTFVVLTNLDKKSPARFIEAKEVTIDDKGNAFVIDAAGNYNIHIEDETPIIPYKTRQFVHISDIVNDSRILVWSEIMALSHPAMVPANKVMLLPDKSEAQEVLTDSIIISTKAGVFSINGQEVHPLTGETMFKNDDGVLMVPVRSIAESFGFDVEWKQESLSVSLFRGAQTGTLTIDSKSYGKQKMLVHLDTAPLIVNNRTHVPVDFLREVLNVDVTINDSEV
ncbi:copper amine oxidase N-terminal domain-containing protein [Desulfuribacillus alkaliarsenatis]|uniref:Copper amine oxidase-like N-terminal domain-containing protein n=1 Tax=Desulfuribacillus alkaliarsenatis TaxID=766136 RepID=A0A1E5G0Z1_9FIRM|nr:copper amine oxidase N-terminal domain-containing protein [Desulfuribacillus alkaliarsenatis]OEF96563.1 hypothetical protein BHF68_07915 [Desulfuribacillus alkaliarsenatis]